MDFRSIFKKTIMNRSFIKSWIILFVFMCCGYFAVAQSEDEKGITELFELQEKYWNTGDIDAYVSLYSAEGNPRMLYNYGEVEGKEKLLAHYKKYFPKEKMGKLRLDDIKKERISSIFYFVSGRFTVITDDGKNMIGRFSGLIKKVNGKWYIYTDHSG